MNSIPLIQEAQLWDQYWQLKHGLEMTEKMLRALGVQEFPESPGTVRHTSAEPRTAVASSFPSVPRLKLTSLVREACKALKKDLTRDAVSQYISSHYPDFEFKIHSVATLLSSAMVKEKLVTLQEPSIGGQQNKYILTDEWI